MTPEEDRPSPGDGGDGECCACRRRPTYQICTVAVVLFSEFLLLSLVLPLLPQWMWLRFGHEIEADSAANCTGPCPPSLRRSKFLQVGTLAGLTFALGYFAQLLITPGLRHVARSRAVITVSMLVGSLVTLGGLAVPLLRLQGWELVVSRVLQCCGTAMVTGAGLARLSLGLPEDGDRQLAFSVTTLGMTGGTVVGPVLGGLLFYIADQRILLSIIAVPIAIEIVLQLSIIGVELSRQPAPVDYVSPTYALALRRQVLIGLVTIALTTAGAVLVNTLLPVWLIHVLNTKSWKLGVLFLPGALGHALGSFLSTCVFTMNGQCGLIAIFLGAMCASLVLLPFMKAFSLILLPMTVIGLGQGFVVGLSMQMLAKYIINVEKESEVTFMVFVEFADKFGSVLGPALGAALLKPLGFPITVIIFGGLVGIMLPLQYFSSDCLFSHNDEKERLVKENEKRMIQ